MIIGIVASVLLVCGTFLAALQIKYAAESAKDIRNETTRKQELTERRAERNEKVAEFDSRLAEVEKFIKTAKWNGKG